MAIRIPRGALALAGLSVIGLGCESGGSEPEGYAAPEDPCALLSEAEVASVLGASPEGEANRPDDGFALCGWEPGVTALWELQVSVWANPNAGEDAIRNLYETLAEASVDDGDETRDISDLETEGFAVNDGDVVNIWWRRNNDYMANITMGPEGGVPLTDDELDELARSMASRM